MTALVPIRRVARVVNGGTPRSEAEYWGGEVLWATPIDLALVDGGSLASTGRTLTTEGLKAGSSLAPTGSILLSTRAPIGYTALLESAAAFNQGCKALVPTRDVDPRFLQLCLMAVRRELQAAGQGSTFSELSTGALLGRTIPFPPIQEQRRIADFLDDQVSRINAVMAARRGQVALAHDAFDRMVLGTIAGSDVSGDRRPSGLRWLGPVPSQWPVLAVSTQFETVLGKMLDERHQSGRHPLPYLRNTNVQWDRVDTHDLKVMDIAPHEYSRFTVRAGDLLICEGGQPGRAAIWDGSIEIIGFQKALHRARTRGRSNPRWLLHCLRAAVAINAFGGENGVTTIGHLTGEQLREQRFPFPEAPVQDRLINQLDDALTRRDALKGSLVGSIELLAEYKQALITAAVTGELDVTTSTDRSILA